MEIVNRNIYYYNLSEAKKNHKKIGEGSTANVYMYDDKLILKLFKKYLDISRIAAMEYFSNINASSFALPKMEVFVSGQLRGYLANYKKGTKLAFISGDIILNDFFNALTFLEQDIIAMANNHVVTVDLHDENVLYDEVLHVISVVDSDEYFIKDSSSDYIRDLNIRAVIFVVANMLFDTKYEIKPAEYLKIMEFAKTHDIDDLKLFFKLYIEYYENIHDKEIITLDDFRQIKK